ncbi:hypothetical protein ACVWW4_003821 [Bradyrhizobium sp. LB7.1]
MPIVIKPRTLGLLSKCERRPPGASLIVSAFAMFDLANPGADRLEGEQDLWGYGRQGASARQPPRHRHAQASNGSARRWTCRGASGSADRAHDVGLGGRIDTEATSCDRRPLLADDRLRLATDGRSTFPANAASPATRVRRAWLRRKSGRPGHEALHRSMAGELVALPNVETPEHAIQFIDAIAPSAAFGPMALNDSKRQQFAGTYDAAWLKSLAPALRDRCRSTAVHVCAAGPAHERIYLRWSPTRCRTSLPSIR